MGSSVPGDILSIYLVEVRTQCRIAHLAFRDMAELLKGFRALMFVEDADRFWYHLNSFLAACANVSKLLWPDKGSSARAQVRGRELCARLRIDQTSPVFSRTLRNHVEHFDERLDKWARSVEATGNLDLYVRRILSGTTDQFRLDKARCFLVFDADNYHITFMGDDFEMMPIVWAIKDLGERAQQAFHEIAVPVSDAPEVAGGENGKAGDVR